MQKELNISCGDYFDGIRLYPDNLGLTDLVECMGCGFARFPEMHEWTDADFKQRIYNQDYHLCDSPFKEERPQQLSKWLSQATCKKTLLDYGGGEGRLVELLCQTGTKAISFDPYYGQHSLPMTEVDIVTAFEVIEHVPDTQSVFNIMSHYLKPDGIILFSTLLKPQTLLADWWYASPRNGHISFHTPGSLEHVMDKVGLVVRTSVAGDGVHIAAKSFAPIADWSQRLAPIEINELPRFQFQNGWDRLTER